MKQLSDCCKAEIKLTGSPRHEDGFACVKCGRIIGTPIKKQKPKELDVVNKCNCNVINEPKKYKNRCNKSIDDVMKPKELDWEKEFEKRFILGDGCIDLDGMGKETVDSLKEFIKLQIQESYWLGIKVMEEENEIQDTRLNNLKNEITEAIKDWSSLSETRRIYKTKVLGILTQILEDLEQL